MTLPEPKKHAPIYPDESREDQYAAGRYVSGWNDCHTAFMAALAATPASPQAPAPQAVVGEAKPIPLTEPVNVAKAMLAHRQAEVWLDGGTGPVCCVGLVNIQVTPWNRHTPSEAKAYAEGFNLAAKWMRNAALTPSPAPSAAPHQGADALREALVEKVHHGASVLGDYRVMAVKGRATREEVAEAQAEFDAALAALAQHQAPQQGEQQC